MSGVLLWAAVAVTGGCGALLRLLVDEAIRSRTGGSCPVGILVVNVSGSLLLGILAGAALPYDIALIAATAFVGAYTTFATWMLDIVNATVERLIAIAIGNLILSVSFGLLAAAIGRSVGMQL
ncbi:MAG: fluoride efflux transporter CrcB [Solirubrobacteraceae bacterium]|nr:fluoride efflux transporter CrcB [Solirubrobacteraceae bacterium]